MKPSNDLPLARRTGSPSFCIYWTRANLLEAFWSVYADLRIDQITVKEIVAKAGYNRGTFYEYFSDVYQCLDQIENMSLPRFDELPPMPNGQVPTTELFETFIKLYESKFKYYNVLLGDRGDPAFQRKLIDSIKKAVVDSGQLPTDLEALELDFLLEYVLSGMLGIMRYYFDTRPKVSHAELLAIMYRIMDSGYMERLGRRMG